MFSVIGDSTAKFTADHFAWSQKSYGGSGLDKTSVGNHQEISGEIGKYPRNRKQQTLSYCHQENNVVTKSPAGLRKL